MENKIKWCCSQKRGILLVEPNTNLCGSYIKEADESLDAMLANKGKWKVITAYYACYNALYSILMKAGIRSEIHDCTIELLKLIDGFNDEDYKFLVKLKQNRIDAQYYLKEKTIDESRIKSFIFKCKSALDELNVEELREKIKAVMEN